MPDHAQPLADRCFGTEVITCPECGHGIDPHGTEPGGICGVGDATGKRCECLMQPNGIAYARLAGLEVERERLTQERDTVAIQALAAHRRIAELGQQMRADGVSVGRMADQLRTACSEGAAANDRLSELEAERPVLGHVIVTLLPGRMPFIHGRHSQLMTVADAIRSVGRSDLPRGTSLLLCELREVADRV